MTAEDKPAPLTKQTDELLAGEIRFLLAPYLASIGSIMDEAKAKGLRVNWSIVQNQDGKHVPTTIDIVRPF